MRLHTGLSAAERDERAAELPARVGLSGDHLLRRAAGGNSAAPCPGHRPSWAMTWTLSSSLDELHSEAGDFLAAHPAENTVLLTVVDRLAVAGSGRPAERAPRFGWWRPEPGAPVAGVFLQTPPLPIRFGLTPPEAGAELAELLRVQGVELGGAGGGRAPVEAFGAAWCRGGRAASRVQVEERLYRLGELTGPSPAPSGRARRATVRDRELLVDWYAAFAAEVRSPHPADYAAMVDRRIAEGGLWLWEDGGRPVSFAGVSPVLAGMSRIGPVFTPPGLRGRGYASGLVAAGSAYARTAGAEQVLLYTDLSNPTSNSIYRKLGYRPVEDCLVLEFV
ncbi:GNAT family N-acetyltransferase [Kitasatospora sp. HPMI-4]|uniref:GNAT family N-acetyltransferase n=1 Tax=Kitasatospora sp. HPMI-4 TaxID=3448443 RepID=UPI003F1CE8C6